MSRPEQRAIPPAPTSETRLLPMLSVGPGDRQTECVRIGDCLRRFVQAHPVGRGHAEKDGHCPPGCHGLELPQWHARLGLAAYWSADHGVERLHTGEEDEDEEEDGDGELAE